MLTSDKNSRNRLDWPLDSYRALHSGDYVTYTNEKVPPPDFGQVFDQVFGQGFDQGLGEGKNHKYSVQYYPDQGKNKDKREQTFN